MREPTPRPWKATAWAKHVFVGGGPNNDDIAEFNFCDEATVKITKDEAIANAALFAASPDLLAAAEAALADYDSGDGLSGETVYALTTAVLKAKNPVISGDEE